MRKIKRKTMKALILTEGGKVFGFGHMTRCRALQQALALEDIRATLVIHGDKAAREHFCLPQDQVLDWLSHAKRLEKLLRGTQIVILDSYHAPFRFYQKMARTVPLLVSLDDYNRLRYPKGIVVAGAIGAEKFPYPKTEGLRYLAGSCFLLLRKEFWNLPKKKARTHIRHVLVTTGGSNQNTFLHPLLSSLSATFSQWKLHVVNAPKDVLPQAKNIRYYTALGAKKMRALMLDCDLALSGGGQTTNELAACGLPTLGIGFAKNQKLNLSGWAKTGFLKSVGNGHRSGTIQKIISTLSTLTQNDRIRMSRAAQNSADGQGALRIAKIISKIARNFPATITKREPL